jgi:hypothetical protein
MAQSRARRRNRVAGLGSKDLKVGTIRAAVRALGIEWDRFVAA